SWLRDMPGREHRTVLLIRLPRSVGRFVMNHQEEGFILWPVAEVIHRQVGDDVGHVALDHPSAVGLDKLRIEIDYAPGRDDTFYLNAHVYPEVSGPARPLRVMPPIRGVQ